MYKKDPQPRVNGRFAKGGVVDTVSKGIETVAKYAGTASGKSILAADKAVAPAPTPKQSRTDVAIEREEKGYAKGGKVNRHGFEPKAAMSATALAAPANGGEETPAAAVTASPSLPVYPPAVTAAAPKLRGTPMKRAGAAPSLPYPKRR